MNHMINSQLFFQRCSNFLSSLRLTLGFKSLYFILVIFIIAHYTSFYTSTHLCSIDLEFNITIMSLNSFFTKDAAKHGPAAGVIPVFKPEYPNSSNLLVFYH